MIKMIDVSAGYNCESIIKDINLTLPSKAITAIIGPNGCGKSTLLKTMTKSIQPFQGEISLHNQPIEAFSLTEFAKHVAILPQVRTIPNTTVETLISHGRFPYLGFLRRLTKEDHDMVDYAMELAGVSSKRHHFLHELSGGERQKVYIAMTLAQNTELIILDEPTTFLDINHQLEVLELITQLKQQGKTIIMVLHDLHHALTYADQVIVMNQGEIKKMGSPSHIYESKIIDSIFGVHSQRFKQGTRSYFFFEKKAF